MFILSQAHQAMAHRKRRTLAQYDVYDIIDRNGRAPLKYENPIEEYKKRLTDYLDHAENTVDCVLWDPEWPNGEEYTQYPSKIRPRFTCGFYGLLEDMYKIYEEAGRKRGLESILCHRITGSDPFYEEFPPVHKLAHPEMYIFDWWKLGLHNLNEPEIRKRKLEALTECMENYDFDGLEIDFCRHTPFLPPGRQWELRGAVTEFMTDVRKMLLTMEEKKGKPMMLYARVPHTVAGANEDGLDVALWADEQIVDCLIIGTRSYFADIEDYRRKTHGLVRLFPCFDYHHCTDGYANAPLEVARGVFSNWWDQGADGIVLFNWMAARREVYQETAKSKIRIHPNCEVEQLREAADPEYMKKQTRTFVAERRGGYPYCNGFANHNMDKPLPIKITQEKDALVEIRTSEARDDGRLTLILSGDKGNICVWVNGEEVTGEVQTGYEDKLIRYPVPVSGFHPDDLDEVEGQSLIRCIFDHVRCVKGINHIRVKAENMQLEKAEITLFQEEEHS